MYQQRHQGHHDEHHHRQTVYQRPDRELHAPRLEPGGRALDRQGWMGRCVAIVGPVAMPDAVVVELDDRHVDLLVM